MDTAKVHTSDGYQVKQQTNVKDNTIKGNSGYSKLTNTN